MLNPNRCSPEIHTCACGNSFTRRYKNKEKCERCRKHDARVMRETVREVVREFELDPQVMEIEKKIGAQMDDGIIPPAEALLMCIFIPEYLFMENVK